ncbi:MAG: ABC transporter ATP-binding protein/permease [Cellulomonadaceae bacterium]|jgi:ATP-binding cassette subfamily B protein|nr:ABC transporter ATP-binding protein/permease [Cellulomonadaceae bacterium]
MKPERLRLSAMVILGIVSVTLSVMGPRILGHATNVLFEGVIGKMLAAQGVPAGTPMEQVLAGMRDSGQAGMKQMADMIAGMDGIVVGQGVNFTRLGQIIMVVVGLYVASFLAGWIQNRIMTQAVQNTMRRLRNNIEEKLNRVPLSYIDQHQRGDILSRVTNDIDNVAQTTTQTFSQLITSALTVVGVLAMMFWISWILALIALVTVPLSVFVVTRIAKKSQPQFVEQWAATGRLNAHIEEMYTGHDLVKVYGQQAASAEKFAQENGALFEASNKAQRISGTIQPVMGFISNLNYVMIAVVGGLRVAHGQLSIGDVQAFIQYSRQFTQPLSQIASMMNLLQSGVASAERVFELLDAPEQSADPADPATLATVQGRVEFSHVKFQYVPDKPLITDLNLVANPGDTVAIVGPTGAGKTTLVNLLMRFYEIDSGTITLDGVDTRTMTRDDLRDCVGMVLQDTWLFKGTIRENLMYGVQGDIPEEKFLDATQACHVDPFVRTLPDGYDTMLDDSGGSLSVGEKQLLTIARAFLSSPDILVLDEATSSVDTRTEVLVQQAMNALRSGRTSFVIAHRLSTIRDADTIVVMEDGDIVETGNHDSLLADGGAYARLYQSQFDAPAIATEAAQPPDPAAAVIREVAANTGSIRRSA